MRILGMIICVVLLAGCTSSVSGAPRPGALTAAKALGDFRTVDYCTMLDAAGGTPTSSFERCWVAEGEVVRVVGPLFTGDDVDGEPYRYAGDLPRGVRIQATTRTLGPACIRWVGFADDLWLSVSSTVVTTPATATATATELCSIADDMVASVLAAIADGEVGHATYGPDSFGSLDACSFLDVPEVEIVVGAGRTLTREQHGHTCLHGYIGLAFSVGQPTTGTPETVAGRAAVVETVGVFCIISFDRPMPDRPGLVETAELTGVAIDENGRGNGADVCPDTRSVADVVVPKLPL